MSVFQTGGRGLVLREAQMLVIIVENTGLRFI